jgi:hypothetical protein
LKPGLIKHSIDLKVTIRATGRTVGDNLLGPLFTIGYLATVVPEQIINITEGKTLKDDWNDYLGDFAIDSAGFFVSELAGTAAFGATSGSGPGALAAKFGGDFAMGLAWEQWAESGARKNVINWLGELPDKFSTLQYENKYPNPISVSPRPWEQIITPIGTPTVY